MKKNSVVSTCYNEEDNVETCYETVRAIFERDLPGYEREHIFIDNRFSDRTVEILNAIFAFTKFPMRFCTFVGTGIAPASSLFALIAVLWFAIGFGADPRGTTTIIVALFFLSGVRLLFHNMPGEYIASIHSQVRGGPMVIKRELVNLAPEAATSKAEPKKVQRA